jgi:heat shock protein HtpX
MSARWAGQGLNEAELHRRRLLNRLQTLLLVATMGCLLGTVGYAIGGWSYALLSVLAIALVYIFNPALSPRMVMSIFRGYPSRYAQAAPLYAALEELSLRAGLPAVPMLYYLPTWLLASVSDP